MAGMPLIAMQSYRTPSQARAMQATSQTHGMYGFLDLTVSQYMTRAVKVVAPDTTLAELERLFEHHDYNSFPVVEATAMVGLVSKFDFLKAFIFTTAQIVPHYDELMRRTVRDVMATTVVHVEPRMPLTRVLELMVDRRSRSFPVINGEEGLVGMIAREDVMRALRDAAGGSAAKPLS